MTIWEPFPWHLWVSCMITDLKAKLPMDEESSQD